VLAGGVGCVPVPSARLVLTRPVRCAGSKYKASDLAKYGKAEAGKGKGGKKGTPRATGPGGGSIEFSSAAVTRSGDWSDSMSDDSDSEMLLLEKSSSGGSGSDSGSALPLDSMDAGALTLDALEKSKAAAPGKPGVTSHSILPAAAAPPRPSALQAAATVARGAGADSKAAAGAGTLGRVLAATQAYAQGNGDVDRKKFLVGLGDDDQEQAVPPVPVRKTAVKGKPAAYAAAAASAAAARGEAGKKISLSLPSDGVTPAKKPRVVAGTGSAGEASAHGHCCCCDRHGRDGSWVADLRGCEWLWRE
jgi:hypothetical protein